jgi:hypothetical protein
MTVIVIQKAVDDTLFGRASNRSWHFLIFNQFSLDIIILRQEPSSFLWFFDTLGLDLRDYVFVCLIILIL